MLNQEDENIILSLGGFHDPQWIGDLNDLKSLISVAYAAGAKDMQARCAKTADSGQYIIKRQAERLEVLSIDVPDIGAAIRALETT